jgi:hypothetical protein
MDGTTGDLTSLLDREAIRDCLARVARGEDRRDAELLRGAYWPDATDDHGVFVGSFQEYLAWVVPGAPAVLLTQHTLGQSLIELRGTRALVETHVTSYHRINMGADHHDLVIGGRYVDQMEQREGEWKIAKRTMLYDWQQDYGRSVDWSNGLLGMPFINAHAVGSTTGDHSSALFNRFADQKIKQG